MTERPSPKLALWHIMAATALLAFALAWPDIAGGPLMIVASIVAAGLVSSLIVGRVERSPGR